MPRLPLLAGGDALLPSLGRELLLVGLGAVPGALLRWRLHHDPLANLLGCFVLGAAAAGGRPGVLLLVGVGFCGALTTFSGWILEVLHQIRRGQPVEAGLGMVGIVLAGLTAVLAGRAAAQALKALRAGRG